MGIDIDTLVKFNLKDQILEPSDMQNIQEYDHYRRVLILQFNTCLIRNVLKEVIQYLEKRYSK